MCFAYQQMNSDRDTEEVSCGGGGRRAEYIDHASFSCALERMGATPFLFLVAAFFPLNVQVQYYLLTFLDDTA